MLTDVHPFTPETAAIISEYCTAVSNDVSGNMKELWEWTCNEFQDAGKMSSPLQAATMQFISALLKPKRILEIGCYTGYSAMAWYEATAPFKAEIITLELDPRMVAASRRTFAKYDLNDRITLIEGPASETILGLTGEFDLVFVDANKDGYEDYVRKLLDRKMLSLNGMIMCDNVLARGMTATPDASPHLPEGVRTYWRANGEALDRFSRFCKQDPRIDSVLLLVYDGLTLIKWKAAGGGDSGVTCGI